MKDIISKNLIVGKIDSNIYDVSILMRDNDIGFLPICSNNKIVGVLTDRDIVTKCLYNKDKLIKDYVNTTIINIDVDSDINLALQKMATYKVKRLLVTDHKKVIGVLSISDILNNYTDNITSTFKSIYQIKDEIDLKPEIDEFYL